MVNMAVGIVLESVNHDMPAFQNLCYYRSLHETPVLVGPGVEVDVRT
jgi:hypothetical protein